MAEPELEEALIAEQIDATVRFAPYVGDPPMRWS